MLKKLLPLVALLLVGCLQGPAGEDGQDGQDALVYTSSGFLTASTREQWNTSGTPLYSWDLDFFRVSGSKIVQVRIRRGAGFAWVAPEIWSMGEGWVRIVEGSTSDAFTGYEYRIVVAE